MISLPEAPECAACGAPVEGNHSIHRDGFGEGPEVELCDACGGGELPSCETLWRMIAKRQRYALIRGEWAAAIAELYEQGASK